MSGITTTEILKGEQPKDELPIMECQRVQAGDGTDRFQFICPKCGETRTHSPEDGFRSSQCHPGVKLLELYQRDNCWPDGYVLKEKNDGR